MFKYMLYRYHACRVLNPDQKYAIYNYMSSWSIFSSLKYEYEIAYFFPVMWILIGVHGDPDPVFYLNAVPDTGSQNISDPSGSGS
jgi:hypothetical protein